MSWQTTMNMIINHLAIPTIIHSCALLHLSRLSTDLPFNRARDRRASVELGPDRWVGANPPSTTCPASRLPRHLAEAVSRRRLLFRGSFSRDLMVSK